MATKLPPYENTSPADGYIDMYIAPPNSTDFEFPLSSNPLQREADKLFYNGKLLPLLQNPLNDIAGSDTTSNGASNSQKKKSWMNKKIKSMRESNLGLKLKASRAYIKSLFTKCDDSKVRACSSGYFKAPKNIITDEELAHRQSFSGAINNWHSVCSSSSSSFSIVNSEAESPIEGAIAHCKKSQQPARKSM